MDNIFISLLKEAEFTNEMLCSGYGQIRNANFAKKGIYFQAFTSLSTGIERIGKIILLLEHTITNNGQFPDLNFMQKNIGHDIVKIYNDCLDIKIKYNFSFNYKQELNDQIYVNILDILSRFGKGDRYSNIDLMINSRTYDDPITVWYNKIDKYIIEKNIKKAKIEKIKAQANFLHNLTSDYSSVYFFDENESKIDTFYEMYLQGNINTLVGPYRQLYVYHVSRFFVELLLNIDKIIKSNNILSTPYFSELFQMLNLSDEIVKSRKYISKI